MNLSKNCWTFRLSKILNVFGRCIKMSQISKEEYKKYEIEIIDDNKYFWRNRTDLEIELDYQNWAQNFDKFDLKNKNTHAN